VASSVPFGGLWSLRSRKKRSNEFRYSPFRVHTCVSEAPLYLESKHERYSPLRVTTQSRAIGTKLMRSEKWVDQQRTKVRCRAIPYIMPSGHMSGSAKLTWVCSSAQWFATTVRAIIERLKRRSIVHRRARYKKWRNLTEIAVLYTLTMDDQMLERLLNSTKKGFRNLFYYHLNRVDAKTRFLYDQALQSALWLELRGKPRVQSTNDYRLVTIYTPGECGPKRAIQTVLDSICDPWIVDGYHAQTRGGCFLRPLGGL
jgi:predicted transcriptional regulator